MEHTIKIYNDLNKKAYQEKAETSNLIEILENTLKKHQKILQNHIFIEIVLKKYIELNNSFMRDDSYINIYRRIDGIIFVTIEFASTKNKIELEFFEGDLINVKTFIDDFNFRENLINKNLTYAEQLKEFERFLLWDDNAQKNIEESVNFEQIYRSQDTHIYQNSKDWCFYN